MRRILKALPSATLLACLLSPAMMMADVDGVITGLHQKGGFAVMANSHLRPTLEGWSRASGWTLIWDQEDDYEIRASAIFTGDFESAVTDLVDSIHLDNPELSVVLYRGNRVIHVENRYSTGD